VVARAEEIEDGVETLTFPSGLAFARYPSPVTVFAVDLAQHAAEKLQALTRPYGDQVNTRVKDLVDLVVLAESGWIDRERLARRLRTVFTVRASHDMPGHLPVPRRPGTATTLRSSPTSTSKPGRWERHSS
jgi:hypothetical protein